MELDTVYSGKKNNIHKKLARLTLRAEACSGGKRH